MLINDDFQKNNFFEFEKPFHALFCSNMNQLWEKMYFMQVNDRVKWLWMAVKNPFLFSIIWVSFRWCASRDSPNFTAFSSGFLNAPPTHPFVDTLMFWYIKCVQVIHIWTSVIYVWFVVLEFWNLNVFIPAESTILGCFWEVFWT